MPNAAIIAIHCSTDRVSARAVRAYTFKRAHNNLSCKRLHSQTIAHKYGGSNDIRCMLGYYESTKAVNSTT